MMDVIKILGLSHVLVPPSITYGRTVLLYTVSFVCLVFARGPSVMNGSAWCTTMYCCAYLSFLHIFETVE